MKIKCMRKRGILAVLILLIILFSISYVFSQYNNPADSPQVIDTQPEENEANTPENPAQIGNPVVLEEFQQCNTDGTYGGCPSGDCCELCPICFDEFCIIEGIERDVDDIPIGVCRSEDAWIGPCGEDDGRVYTCNEELTACTRYDPYETIVTKTCAQRHICTGSSDLTACIPNLVSRCTSDNDCLSDDCYNEQCRTEDNWRGSCRFLSYCNEENTGCGSRTCAEDSYCNNYAWGGRCNLKKSDGENCEESYECESGDCYELYLPEGVCRSEDAWIGGCTGNSCLQDGTRCRSGFGVFATPRETCAEGYHCQDYGSWVSCISDLDEGSACTHNYECINGNCENGLCTEISEVIPSGALCDIDSDCGEGEYCLDGNCVLEELPVGTEEEIVYDWTGLCVMDQFCNLENTGCGNRICADNYYCNNGPMRGVCDLKKANEEICDQNYECESDSCIGGICTEEPALELGGFGSACSTNDDCNSNSCYTGICRNTNNWVGECTGTSCMQDGTRCRSGFGNSIIPRQTCAEGYHCHNYVSLSLVSCILDLDEDSACTQDYECESDSCIGGICTEEPALEELVTDIPCDTDDNCDEEQYCNTDSLCQINSPPAAEVVCTSSAPVNQPIICDGSGSNDIDLGDSINYQWSFSGLPISTGGTTTESTSYTHNQAGSYSCTLEVTDSRGARSISECQSTVFECADENDPSCVVSSEVNIGTVEIIPSELGDVSAPLEPGGTGAGGGAGGEEGGSGGGGTTERSCTNLGGIVCNADDEGFDPISADQSNCYNECRSRSLFVQTAGREETARIIKTCTEDGKTKISVVDEDNNPVEGDVALSLGYPSNSFIDPEDHSCMKILTRGEPTLGYGLVSLLLTILAIALFYIKRKKFF